MERKATSSTRRLTNKNLSRSPSARGRCVPTQPCCNPRTHGHTHTCTRTHTRTHAHTHIHAHAYTVTHTQLYARITVPGTQQLPQQSQQAVTVSHCMLHAQVIKGWDEGVIQMSLGEKVSIPSASASVSACILCIL